MAGSKQEAQEAFDAARERYAAARKDLRQTRRELDEHLREESVRSFAVYLGFEEGDEEGLRAARAVYENRRKQRATAEPSPLPGDDLGDGPIGGAE